MRIALVPNDDGYGPSALGFYVAKALLRRGASLVIRNESALTLNSSFYRTEIGEGKVSLQPTFGGIRLRKTAEGVDVTASLRDLQNYPARSAKYVVPPNVEAVVDIGTPPATKAAKVAGIPGISIFDHSWAKTYEMLLDECCHLFGDVLGSKPPTTETVTESEVAKAIDEIRKDESTAQMVFLFPEYITPAPYYRHWKSLNVRIEPIGGVFGGSSVTRVEARKRMGIPDSAPRETVYVLGGGTPVWDAKVPEIVLQLKEKTLSYNVVVFDRNAKPNEYIRVGHNVYKGGAVDGETVQGLLPGVDLVVTRAGGGIVNDAIACRVPLVCVEEPKHRQVEMIRKCCEEDELTRTIGISEFRTSSFADIVQRELGNRVGNRRILAAMKKIKNGMEEGVAQRIIQSCSSSRNTSSRTNRCRRRCDPRA